MSFIKKAFDVTLNFNYRLTFTTNYNRENPTGSIPDTSRQTYFTFLFMFRMDEEVKKLKDMHFNYNSGIKGLEGKEVARLKNILE